MEKQQVLKYLNEILTSEEIIIDEPMKKHTTFKVGGNVDIMVIPQSRDAITGVIKTCSENNIPLLVFGNGSNLIVRDKGIRGVVMKIFNNFSEIFVDDNVITAQAGALLSKVANTALKNNFTGLEFAAGIPGTLGGAVAMNAGAYGGEMKDIVVETEYVDKNGEVGVISGADHKFEYRKSIIQEMGYTVLQSKLELKNGEYGQIKAVMDELSAKRREKQPLTFPSAGSVFKRPEGHFAGKLIEDCGLKGYSIGGAQVSELHSGFIINYNNATSKDIIDLIKYVQDKVKEKFGVQLDTEVKIVGEE